MKTIVILRDHSDDPMKYSIDHYIVRWRKSGYRVLDHIGPENVPSGDVVVVHIDASVIPSEYIQVINRFPKSINGRILDITRRNFSQILLSERDDYTGAVLVKTNANYGGSPEYETKRSTRYQTLEPSASPLSLIEFARQTPRILKNRLVRLCQKLRKRLLPINWKTVEVLNPYAYPIYENIQAVPKGVWKNPHLVVEKFLGQQVDGLFTTYYYVFFGSREIVGRLKAESPIVKFTTCVEDIELEVPDFVRQWRKELQIDFGRFDYLEFDGQFFLIDVNKTEGGGASNEQYADAFDYLAAGLEDYLD